LTVKKYENNVTVNLAEGAVPVTFSAAVPCGGTALYGHPATAAAPAGKDRATAAPLGLKGESAA